MATAKALVYYHANCTDGFGAAYVFHKFMEKNYEEVKYIPSEYGKTSIDLGEAKGADVFVLDFSFSKEMLLAAVAHVSELTIIDHHKTAKEDLADWLDGNAPPKINLFFNMEKSGAGLAWDIFAPDGMDRSQLVNYIEDRDLWKFALQHSKQINAYVGNRMRNFAAYRDMEVEIEQDKDSVAFIGQQLKDYDQRICEDIANNLARNCTFYTPDGPITGLIANCTGHFASEVGNILAKRSGTFGATYFTDPNGNTKVSLRSIGDFDVSKLAQRYGGGGHRNAAGFVMYSDGAESTGGVSLWRL